MHSILKKIFGLSSKKAIDNHFITYNESTVNKYRNQYKGKISFDEMKVPNIDPNQNFKITEWFKNDGDEIAVNEPLCQLESKKLVVVVESFIDGFIYFRQRPNMYLNTGQVICLVLHKPQPN